VELKDDETLTTKRRTENILFEAAKLRGTEAKGDVMVGKIDS
jgi:hypothetical protein